MSKRARVHRSIVKERVKLGSSVTPFSGTSCAHQRLHDYKTSIENEHHSAILDFEADVGGPKKED